MTFKPSEIYLVDLEGNGNVIPMVVISREDSQAPRSLVLCAPITTSFRESSYEISLGKKPFLNPNVDCWVNLQGIQAVQYHELKIRVDFVSYEKMEEVKKALRFVLNMDS